MNKERIFFVDGSFDYTVTSKGQVIKYPLVEETKDEIVAINRAITLRSDNIEERLIK